MRLEGRGISPGRSEGKALVLGGAFSFLGGVDTATGRLRVEGRDDPLEGRVLVFPRGKGSTVGSYVILDLARSGFAPSAIVNAVAEPIVATGAVMARIPMVDGIDLSLIKEDDAVVVDADMGAVELPGVREIQVVTSILIHRGHVLLLRRSEKVASCRGMWAGVSGMIEPDEGPLQAAVREVGEEVGIPPPSLVRVGEPIRIRRHEVAWVVHPFLFEVETRDVVTDWEHVDHRWISPSELGDFHSVPGLDRVFRSLGLV